MSLASSAMLRVSTVLPPLSVLLVWQNAKTSGKTIQSLRDEVGTLTQSVEHLRAEGEALKESHKAEVQQLNDSYTKQIDDLNEGHRQKVANLEVGELFR